MRDLVDGEEHVLIRSGWMHASIRFPRTDCDVLDKHLKLNITRVTIV